MGKKIFFLFCFFFFFLFFFGSFHVMLLEILLGVIKCVFDEQWPDIYDR